MELSPLLLKAGTQYGCITRNQALEVVSRNQLDRLVHSGILIPEHVATYSVAGYENTWTKRAAAAVLSVPGSALSYQSAVRWHGHNFAKDDAVHITVTADKRPTRRNVVVHTSEQLNPFVDSINGLAATNLARSLVDCSKYLTQKQLAAWVDQACNQKLVKLEEISHCLERMPTQGRRSISKMRNLLLTRNLNDQDLDTFLERRTLTWMREAELPEPVVQRPLIANGTLYRPDIQYRKLKIAIEPDGPHHLYPSVASYDRKRDVDLQLEGWIVFHVYIDDEPIDLIPRVRKAMKQRAYLVR